VSKSFGTAKVLDSVDLSLAPSSILALLGTNGAGKSTLIKIISGLYHADSGEVLIDGSPVQFASPRDAMAAGVRLLPQEISIVPDLSVAENVLLGQLPVRHLFGLPGLDRRTLRDKAARHLAQVGLDIDPATLARRLGIQQLRLMEIARALAGEARVLIMDEPTASLSDKESRELFANLDRVRQSGTSIIYISHYLDEVFEIADDIVVLRDGRVTGQFARRDASEQEVLQAMLGRRLDHLFPPASERPLGDPVLEFRGARLGGAPPLDLSIAAGEIVGVIGLLGSGYDLIGTEVFAGRSRVAGGEVLFRGAPMAHQPGGRISRRIGFVPAERKRDGIVPEMNIVDNICLPLLRRFDHGWKLDKLSMQAFARERIGLLAIKTDSPRQQIRQLSGGNQQKACLSRFLESGFELLVLEEPTRGVDLGARQDIYAQIRRFADAGGAVLLISSDVEEIAGCADRSLVFNNGQIAAQFARGAEKAELMAAAARSGGN
jgi:ribose transport system ATP-binding protein